MRAHVRSYLAGMYETSKDLPRNIVVVDAIGLNVRGQVASEKASLEMDLKIVTWTRNIHRPAAGEKVIWVLDVVGNFSNLIQ